MIPKPGYGGSRLKQISHCWLANWLLRSGDVWRRAVWLCSLKLVNSACLLNFLPALYSAGKQFCKSPRVSQQDTRSASSPAALRHRLLLCCFLSFPAKLDPGLLSFLQSQGRNVIWKRTCELRARQRRPTRNVSKISFHHGHSLLVTKYSSALQFFEFSLFFCTSPSILNPLSTWKQAQNYWLHVARRSEVWSKLCGPNIRFTVFTSGLVKEISPSCDPPKLMSSLWHRGRHLLTLAENRELTYPRAIQRLALCLIHLKESCLFSVIIYHQRSGWTSNHILPVKTWFSFITSSRFVMTFMM